GAAIFAGLSMKLLDPQNGPRRPAPAAPAHKWPKKTPNKSVIMREAQTICKLEGKRGFAQSELFLNSTAADRTPAFRTNRGISLRSLQVGADF
ncbi:MAG: hypothetical protein LAN61_10260, partial [Acidobacteriia bacterium]|nr:hypothetical protein [Terriglobia bacterium]